MKKQLTEKTVYEPNTRVKITVTNKPVVQDDHVTGYEATVAITYKAGTRPQKLNFGTDEDIAKFVEDMDIEDPQTSLLDNEEN